MQDGVYYLQRSFAGSARFDRDVVESSSSEDPVDRSPSERAFTRSGVKGTCRMRTPVASKMALPTAAAMTVIAVSPAPVASTSWRSIKTLSTDGHLVAQRQAVIRPPVDRRHLLHRPT